MLPRARTLRTTRLPAGLSVGDMMRAFVVLATAVIALSGCTDQAAQRSLAASNQSDPASNNQAEVEYNAQTFAAAFPNGIGDPQNDTDTSQAAEEDNPKPAVDCDRPPYDSSEEAYRGFAENLNDIVVPTVYLGKICRAKYQGFPRTDFYNVGITDKQIDGEDTVTLGKDMMLATKKWVDKVCADKPPPCFKE